MKYSDLYCSFRYQSPALRARVLICWLWGVGMLLAGLGLGVAIVLFGVQWRERRAIASAQVHPSKPFPTALPWIKTQQDCAGNDRVWRDNLCFDRNHDPMF